MKDTKIEWADHTFNPWEGCTRVSLGCAHCYAETRNARFGGGTAPNWGLGAPRRRTSAANWAQPLKWDREAAEIESLPDGSAFRPDGWHRPRVFCASLADWLDDEVPIEWLADLLDLIRRTPSLDWLLLTKRPQNWHERIRLSRNHLTIPNGETALWLANWLPKKESAGMLARAGTPPANVWIGTTVEDQPNADRRIPALLQIPARVRFLSCEPLIGPLDLSFGNPKWRTAESYHAEIHWVICGGESGPKARPMHPDWARSLRDQCAASRVPFLFKQWGEWVPCYPADASHWVWKSGLVLPVHQVNASSAVREDAVPIARVGKHSAGRLLDVREHNEFPEVRHA